MNELSMYEKLIEDYRLSLNNKGNGEVGSIEAKLSTLSLSKTPDEKGLLIGMSLQDIKTGGLRPSFWLI